MQVKKTAFAWVLFALCLVTSFGFGYFVRGTVDMSNTKETALTTQSCSPMQTSTPTAKPLQSANTSAAQTTAQTTADIGVIYILNTDSKKIHYPSCSSATKISDKNKGEHTGDYTVLLERGYTTCGICFKK